MKEEYGHHTPADGTAVGTGNGAVEREVEEVANELHINLPGWESVDWPVRLIALLALVFGLSTLGGIVGGVFSAAQSAGAYLLQVVVGAAFIAIAYGLIMRRRWAVWVYGIIVVVGLLTNLLFAILPLLIVLYLYWRRDYFTPSVFDELAARVFHPRETV